MNLKSQTQRILVSIALAAFSVILVKAVTQTTAQMGNVPYDLKFIDMMIMHHQEGVEMAQMAVSKAQRETVKAFAQKTASEQQKDIEELQGYRKQWYADAPTMDHSARMSMMGSTHSKMMMNMDETKKKLESAEGAAFDRLFLDTMTKHHQMAVRMGNTAKTKASHSELKAFAREAVQKQKAEIAEMNRLKTTR